MGYISVPGSNTDLYSGTILSSQTGTTETIDGALLGNLQSFSALKKIACARAQRSDGNFEHRSRSRSIFRQSSALARAQ